MRPFSHLSFARAFCVLGALSVSVSAFAAEDYTASATSGSSNDQLWSGGAEANANISQGNTDVQSYGASLNVDYKPKPWTVGAKVGYMRTEADDAERARAINGLVRTGANITNNVDFFALGTYQQNRFRGIQHQWMAMPGVGIYAINSDAVSIRVQGGIGYMNEQYSVFRADRNFSVGSAGVGLKFVISEFADFTTDAQWITPLSDSDDWRVMNIAAVTTRMTEMLSLKLSHNLQYRAIPVNSGFRPTDQMMTASIVAKF